MDEYQNTSDYLRDLIRHDHEETEQLLMEGINSGKSKPLDMAALKKKAQSLLR
jgi:Arc/MetJ-type ribon-helix-helix transcriptional regulator